MKDINIEAADDAEAAEKVAEALKAAKAAMDTVEEEDVDGHSAWSINVGCSCAAA